jgi:hypothetical protein
LAPEALRAGLKAAEEFEELAFFLCIASMIFRDSMSKESEALSSSLGI